MSRTAAAVLAVLIGLYAEVAHATGTVAYGSRVGMEVTVISVEGLGTSNAVIHVKHTPENAKTFCTEYAGDPSAECVTRTLRETRLKDVLRGNCQTGVFTTLYGDRMQFLGKNRANRDPLALTPEYRILSLRDRSILDATSASGYAIALDQFKALCPGRAY